MHRVLQLALLVAVCVVFATVAGEPSLRVAFLYSTNDASSRGARGVFRLQNDQNGDVVISKSSIDEFDESKVAGWQYFTDVNMERKWESSRGMGIVYPPGATLFQTWIPPTGGLYRLSLVCFPPTERTNRGKIQSGAFRVSAGPPALPFVLISGAIATETNGLPHTPAEKHIITMPTNFIRRIVSTDHVIVRCRGQDPEFKSVKLDLTGKRAKSVIEAVSQLKNDRIAGMESTRCNCENWTLEFYHGTNCLAVTTFVEDVVDIGEEYRDGTGTLTKIHEEMSDMEEKRMLELWKSRRTN